MYLLEKCLVQNKDIILFTNHFDLGFKENPLKIDWAEILWSFPGKLLWFQRNRGRPKTIISFE